MTDKQVETNDRLSAMINALSAKIDGLTHVVIPRNLRRLRHRLAWATEGNVIDQAGQAGLLSDREQEALISGLCNFDGLDGRGKYLLNRTMNFLFKVRANGSPPSPLNYHRFNGATRVETMRDYGHDLVDRQRHPSQRDYHALQGRGYAERARPWA